MPEEQQRRSGGLRLRWTISLAIAIGVCIGAGQPMKVFADTQAQPPAAGEEKSALAGEVKGVLRDARTKLPVKDATIEAREQNLVVRTDENGVFQMQNLPAGEIVLRLSAPGYRTVNTRVELSAAGGTVKDFWLLPEGEGARTMTVVGHQLSASRDKVIMDREKQSAVSEQLSQEDLKQSTESNVSGALKSVPAVSIQEGKFAYVRGLGDRYSQTLVNGAIIPSPEPERRTIPLDLFPNNLLESLVVVKTYSPELPGEFAGGSVQIHTLDVPPEPFFQIGFGGKYRNGTTFQDFQSYEGGHFDTFTFDDGTRELPAEIPPNRVPPNTGGAEAQVQELGRSFENIWDHHADTAPPDHKLLFAGGTTLETESGSKLGIVAGGNWVNKYQNIEDEKLLVLEDQGVAGIGVRNEFVADTSQFTAELSGMLNLTYQFNPAQRVGFRNLVSRVAEDRVRTQEGFVDNETDQRIRTINLRWVERFLYSGQLYGEHLLAGDQLLEWRYTYSLTERDEPDNRLARYQQADPGGPFLFESTTGSGNRDFSVTNENVQDFGLDYSIPFNPFGTVAYGKNPDEIVEVTAESGSLQPDQKIQFGVAQTVRDREFEYRRFHFNTPSGGVDTDGNLIDYSLGPEEIFTEENINPNGVYLEESTRPTDAYDASHLISAGYLAADFRALPRLRLQGGARVEKSDQQVESFSLFGVPPDRRKTELNDTDVLPAANVSVDLTTRSKLRFAYSETVNRPEFRELAEFEFTDASGGYSAVGNPNLERAQIQSFDARWEWYPSGEGGELLSMSLFRKNLDQPIEKVLLPTGNRPLTSWENADTGELHGFEIEAQKDLGFILEELEYFRINVNYSKIDSEVKASKNSSLGVQTNDTRPMQGQPEYTFNAGLFFETPEKDGNKVTSALTANVFGETLSAVGAYGVPDEVELPRWTLDFTIAKKTGPSTLRMTWENILDSKYEYQQGSFTTREFRRGWAIGISYTYSF